MKFSVIIPVYNASKFIDYCVESVLSQSYSDLEVILINDGSTDKSGEICEGFARKDNRVKVYHQENQGAAVARNHGIRKATGDYLLFPDSDDYYASSLGFEEINNQLEETKADVLIHDSFVERGNGTPDDLHSSLLREEVLKLEKIEFIEYLIKKDKLTRSAWTKVISRSFLSKNNILFPTVRQTEDTGFTAELVRLGNSFDWYEKQFYAYVKHDESVTAKRLPESIIHDSFSVIKTSVINGELIKDSRYREAYYSYLAYPYVVLIGQTKEAINRGGIKENTILNDLKQYSFLMKYNLNPKLKVIKHLYKLFGYSMIVFLLSVMMELTYRKQGV